MLGTLILLVLLILTTHFWLRYFRKRNSDGDQAKFPPGPWRLPIIGNLHQLGREPFKSFMKLREKHGDIFSMQLGSQTAIVLNTHKDIREAQALLSLSGRLVNDDLLEHCRGAPRGVVLNLGQSWMEQRRFVLRTLRDFGFGRQTVEAIIQTEVAELLETLQTRVGIPTIFTKYFNPPVSNVIWTIVNGQRVPQNDSDLVGLLDALHKYSEQAQQVSLALFFPWLKYFRRLYPSSYERARKDLYDQLYGYMRQVIADCRMSASDDKFSQPSTFIETYLREISNTTNPNSSFFQEEGRRSLEVVLFDLFGAGSETTATTLCWNILLLAMHPQVQDKLFEEIRTVIGLERLPSLSDRQKMPYAEAVIAEVNRVSSLVPLSIPHTATEKTFFKGYTIPKDTLIIANLYGTTRDPNVWTRPDDFLPERFLTKNGKEFVRHEGLIPFSVGKRICLGMNLAQDELFLFVTSLFQRFRVGPTEGGDPLRIEYHLGTVLTPKLQPMILHER